MSEKIEFGFLEQNLSKNDPNSTLEQKIEKCQTGIGEHGGSGEENSGHELEHLGKRQYLNL